MLIVSASQCFAQTHKKISLDDRATNIISELKEVKELEKEVKKTGRTISYIIDNETKNYVEISVCENVPKEGRMNRIYFYKYYSNGKLYKMDVVNDKYILIKSYLSPNVAK